MALIVEDGTVVTGAESLGSVSDADTYHNNMGNTAWTALTAVHDKEVALRLGTRHLMMKFRPRWKGWRVSTAQVLDWPRIGVFIYDVAAYPTGGRLDAFAYQVPNNQIPDAVKQASFEAALITLTEQLMPSLEQQVESFAAGSVRVNLDKFSPQQTRYPLLVSLLRPYLHSSGPQIALAR